MKSQASIKWILLMTLLAVIGMFTAQRARATGQADFDSHGYQEFNDRAEAYEKLHKKAEKSLPALKKKTSKQEVIAAHQQAMVDKLRELRSGAKQGDIFTPAATVAIVRVIKDVFAGADAHRVKTTIQAGNPLQGFEVQVNQKYPETLPFTTVPPTLLQRLPGLPDDVAYRILGSALLLVDRKANMIIDFMPNAIP